MSGGDRINLTGLSLDGHELNIPEGLSGLLSDPKLWSKNGSKLREDYERKVVRKNGRLRTVLTKKVAVSA